jgi:hypothetical protein
VPKQGGQGFTVDAKVSGGANRSSIRIAHLNRDVEDQAQHMEVVRGEAELVGGSGLKFGNWEVGTKHVPQDVDVNLGGLAQSTEKAVVFRHWDLRTRSGRNVERRAARVRVKMLRGSGIKHPSLGQHGLLTGALFWQLLMLQTGVTGKAMVEAGRGGLWKNVVDIGSFFTFVLGVETGGKFIKPAAQHLGKMCALLPC